MGSGCESALCLCKSFVRSSVQSSSALHNHSQPPLRSPTVEAGHICQEPLPWSSEYKQRGSLSSSSSCCTKGQLVGSSTGILGADFPLHDRRKSITCTYIRIRHESTKHNTSLTRAIEIDTVLHDNGGNSDDQEQIKTDLLGHDATFNQRNVGARSAGPGQLSQRPLRT